MALYGVLGDIHGNREALLATLYCLDRRGVDGLACVGDIVGYNADPDECVTLLRNRRVRAVAGNHDLIGIGRLGFARCSSKATYALKHTRRALAPDTAAYLDSLPDHLVLENRLLLVHGGIRDVEQYLVTPGHIRRNAAYLRADFPGLRVCLFGHTHQQKVYELESDEVRELPLTAPIVLREDRVYFVNPGAVDASRKRGRRVAEFALLDTSTMSVELHRIAYDHASSEAKAMAGGYRMGTWTERLYTLRHRLSSVLRRWPGMTTGHRLHRE